jgi:YihY family inner membrane protein
MKPVRKTVAAADRIQRREPWLAFPVAVWKKFGDDRSGYLAALISYYGFAAIFPLLLVLATVLDLTLKSNPSLRESLTNSALAQYPVIGQQISSKLGTVPGSGLVLGFGTLLLLLGARGVAGAMQNAMFEIWDVPRDDRPHFPLSVAWTLALTLCVGIGFMLTTFLSGIAGGAGHVLTGAGAHVGTVAVSLVLNVGMFWFAFRLATTWKISWRHLLSGAVVAGIVWQVLLVLGGYIVSHQLHRASQLYGTFGVVLGLMAWLYLQAKVTLLAAEIDVVRVKRLWPRSLQSQEDGPAASSPGREQNAGGPGTRVA